MTMEILAQETRALLDISLSAAQLAAFEHYAIELTRWNERHNLTTIIDPVGIQIKHFLDSLTCLLARPAESVGGWPLTAVDVGAGAGFPGLPLKIVCPDITLTLVEATGKKCDFMEQVVRDLQLEAVTVLRMRAEDVGRDAAYRERFDWALGRAVARMPVLMEYLLPLLRAGGICVAQKGDTAHAETQEAERAFALLGGEVRRLVPVELPGVVESRYLVVVEKVSATPAKYPRRAGRPNKKPIANEE